MTFEMQKLTYFVEGNIYTGSRTGEAGELLRYRVAPDRENGQLLAWAWQEDKCFERAGEKSQKAFPISDEGLEQIQAWLREEWPEQKPEGQDAEENGKET